MHKTVPGRLTLSLEPTICLIGHWRICHQGIYIVELTLTRDTASSALSWRRILFADACVTVSEAGTTA